MHLVEIFYEIDKFCKQFQQMIERNLLTDGSGKRERAFNLLLSEVITIAIYLNRVRVNTSNNSGPVCCNLRLSQSLTYPPATLTEEQKKVFARNRKIAACIAAPAFGTGSFYAGCMLYRNADKLMAMLPK